MAVVHVEGAGVLGSAIIRALAAERIDFTWTDIDSDVVAWKASTGCVYPAGDDRSMADWRAWRVWHRGLMADVTAEVPMLVGHLHPFRGTMFTADLGPLRVLDAPAVMVDVPAMVTSTRQQHALRRAEDPKRGPLVVAHSGGRLQRWSWGWSVEARAEAKVEGPFTAYQRFDRWRIRYLHWQPRGIHLGGSTLVTQRRPKALDVRKHVDSWLRDVVTWEPAVRVLDLGEIRQGWRPVGDEGPVRVSVDGSGRRVIEVPSLAYSGVRWAPKVVAEVLAALR